MEFSWPFAVGLFFISLALDVVYALYTIALVKRRPVFAANMSVLNYLLGATGVVSYVHNRWYLVPLALGAFIGSYAVVKYEAVKHDQKK